MAKVLFGQGVRDPLPIDHLALGKRDVHGVGDPVLEVVGFQICGIEHERIMANLVILAIYTILL